MREVVEERRDQVAGGRGGLSIKMCPECGHIMIRTTSKKSGECLVALNMYVYRCTSPSCGYEEPCLASEDLDTSHDSDKMF